MNKSKALNIGRIFLPIFLTFFAYQCDSFLESKAVLFDSIEEKDAYKLKNFLQKHGLDVEVSNGSMLVEKEREKEALDLIEKYYVIPGESIQKLTYKIIHTEDELDRKVYSMRLQIQLIRQSILHKYGNQIENVTVNMSYENKFNQPIASIVVFSKDAPIDPAIEKDMKLTIHSIIPFVNKDFLILTVMDCSDVSRENCRIL